MDFTQKFGATLRKPNGGEVSTAEALADVDAIGIYFSAHWCPPCRGFTPVLSEKYTGLKAAGKKVEIIFASSDSDEAAFTDYHNSMTFLGLPYSERSLKETMSTEYKVRGIPSLVFIDGKTGELITDSGRGGISSSSYVEDFPYHPKPCYDLSENANGINGNASLVVLYEHASSSEKQRIGDMVRALAAEEFKKSAEERRVKLFFTGAGGGPAGQIRGGVGLPTAPLQKHQHPLESKEGGRYRCDGCHQGKNGTRFRCTEGCDFDYCAECNATANANEGKALNEALITPQMMILDFDDEGAYYRPAEAQAEVTKANLEALISGFKGGSLTKTGQFGR